jgi:hypothetical protein
MPATFYVIVQILSESSSENEPPVHPCIVARGPWPAARGSRLDPSASVVQRGWRHTATRLEAY